MKRPEGFRGTPPDPPSPPPKERRSRDARRTPRDTAAHPTAGASRARPARGPRAPRERSSRDRAASAALRTADAGSSSASARRLERRAARERRRAERAEVRRFTRQSRRRRLTATIALGTLVTLVGGAAAISVSPLLSLTSIRIVGTERLDADEVAAALEDRRGTPLAFVSDEQIRTDLEGFALIRSFSTEIVPPSTLIVRVVERAPIGALRTAGGFEVVDAAGVVVETTETVPPGIPLLSVESASADDPAFRGLADVLLALPRELRSSVVTISATTRDDVRFTLGGAEHSVVWGSAERSAFKARVLAAALSSTDQSVRGEYDVSAPDSLVVRRAS